MMRVRDVKSREGLVIVILRAGLVDGVVEVVVVFFFVGCLLDFELFVVFLLLVARKSVVGSVA